MAWPTTKASTANTDSPTDLISAAREDIKQNIDNVNAMIDTVITTGAKNGWILAYNNGNFEFVPPGRINIISFDSPLESQFEDSAGGGYITYDGGLTQTVTPGLGAVSVSNNRITFPAGTYVFNSGTISYTYFSGGSGQIDIAVQVIEDDSVYNTLLTISDVITAVEPGPFTTKEWSIDSQQVTFTRETTVRIEYAFTATAGGAGLTLPNWYIEKII